MSLRSKVASFCIASVLPVSAVAQSVASQVTPDDVLKMVSVGISDQIIATKIHQHNKPLDLSTDDLVRLKKAHVSDGVIQELMDPSIVPQIAVAAAAPTTITVNPLGSGVAPAASGATPSAGEIAGDPNDPQAPHDSGIYIYSTDRSGKAHMVELERTS